MNRQTLPCKGAIGLVTRRDRDGRPQTLVFTRSDGIRPLESRDGTTFALGEPVPLTKDRTPCQLRLQYFCSPVYDAATSCIYWIDSCAIMRMDSHNAVSCVAGEPGVSGSTDGPGNEARFPNLVRSCCLTTDGRGVLYRLDTGNVRKVAVGGDAAMVTTHRITGASSIECIAYSAHDDVLLGASRTAVYRLVSGGDGGVRAELIAGQEGGTVHRDGVGASSSFSAPVPSMVVDGQGRVYLSDYDSGRLMTVDPVPSGLVTTFLNDGPTHCRVAAILPQGRLALVQYPPENLIVVSGLGIQASPLCAAGGAAAATPARATKQLSELLQGPGVTFKVGGKRFWVHRDLLVYNSEFFRGLLEGGFAEGGATELKLPEQDHEAFACLLCYLYTGRLDVPDSRLRPVAELAGHLLLLEVCAALEQRLLATTSPETIAADLLWAERHSMTGLLAGLKDYFVAHARAAMQAQPDSARMIVEGSPGLAAEVLTALAER